MKKKAIIIGASSGIGRELAIQLLNSGYRIGITARRVPLLQEIKGLKPKDVLVREMDLLDTELSRVTLSHMFEKMGKVDLVIINSGTGSNDPDLDFKLTQQIIGVNVTGFAAMASLAYNLLAKQRCGTLVGVSSIAGIRGNAYSPTYPASKAFMATYLEGLRCKSSKEKANVTVIDVKPGFVDTAMGQHEKAFWRASTEKAVKQMLSAISRKKETIVVTRRWYLIAWLMKWLPSKLYQKI